MEAIVLKVVITPVLVGVASLAGRRWGAEIGGWLVGIPFTSGPIAFFLALSPGPHFAAEAAVGILAGTVSQAAFALAYGWVALRGGLAASFSAAVVAFIAITAALDLMSFGAWTAFVMGIVSLVVAIVLMPGRRTAGAARVPLPPLPWWDIPVRMLVATVFVVALTAAAPALGSRLAGLLSPFPLYATVLAVFAHRLEGGAAATAVLRGLLLGLFAFTGFFLTVAVLLESHGILVAFAAALALALAVQGSSLFVSRRLRVPG